MTDQLAAIARLEAHVEHLLAAAEKRDAMMERMAAQIDAMQRKLDQGAGGVAVLRWFGFGSLVSVLGVAATVYAFWNKE